MSQAARQQTVGPKPTDRFSRAASGLLDGFRAQRPVRASSLLVTVFGDAIAPHGGTVWLGALINVLAGFGIKDRLVRTSVFRLAKGGWLENQQVGRRSYYSLTPLGRSRCDEASRRIYTGPRQDWSGSWTMVLLSGVAGAERETVRKELRWLGFAPFSANLMAHPAPDSAAVESHLKTLAVNDRLLILQSRIDTERNNPLRELVQRGWQLEELQNRYTGFLERFRPVYRSARFSNDLDPELAFRIRTLLVHEYRKILLRDPMLPESLLPPKWAGIAAYQLCRNLYSVVAGATERFLTETMETADGPLPPAEPQYFLRFGGLAR